MASLLLALGGCSMCAGPFDFSYPTYGGFLQRAQRDTGRVGSVYSDPNFVLEGPSANSNLETVEEGDSMGLPENDFMDGFDSEGEGELPEPKLDDNPPGNGPVPDDVNVSVRRWQVQPVTSSKNWR